MRSFVTPLLLLAPLGACSTAPDDYPSLALRDAERAAGVFEPVEPAPYVPPPTPAAVLGQLTQLTAAASGAHQDFLAATPGARALASAARGAVPGSESWARAQVAIAGLEAERSRAMIALADLDRLMVDAAVQGGDLDPIASARDTVIAQVEEQNRTIEALLGNLR